MKYAFVFASNVFFSDDRTVSYADSDTQIEFLKILSFYNHRQNKEDNILAIDADFNTNDDEPISIQGNRLEGGSNFKLETKANRIHITRAGHEEPLLDIYQLPEEDYDALPSHISSEIEAQQPEAVFTIKGDFKVGEHRIEIDNEKLYVNGDSYATGKTNAHEGVKLMPYGIVY